MGKASIPVYDIRAIGEDARHGLMVMRFSDYLQSHYEHLRHPHRHSFWHLVLFTQGSGTHTIDFERFELRRGQAYFMIPGQVHGWEFGHGVDGYIAHFDPGYFSGFLQDPNYLERFPFFDGSARNSVCQLPEPALAEAVRTFEKLIAEAARPEERPADYARLLLLEFFMLTARNCAAGEAGRPQQRLLDHFRRLIETHYKELRLPRDYAELLYVTPNHLNALCRDLLGKTAGDLIRERVLLEAKRLLVNADLPVASVADALRFEDPSYFSRFFRKYEGLTPEVFRKAQLNR